MAGYRPGNIGGILDWYEALCRDPTWRPFYRTPGHVDPAPDMTKASGQTVDPTMAMLLRMKEKMKNGKRGNSVGLSDIVEGGLSTNGVQRGVGCRLPAGPG
jgi:hypothetical protein